MGCSYLQPDHLARVHDVVRIIGPLERAHQVDRVVQRQTQQALAIHMGDEVARLDGVGPAQRRDEAWNRFVTA
mgnify:CR=1 FL=1